MKMLNAYQINENYYYPENEAVHAENFFNAYNLEVQQNCEAIKVGPFKDRKDRICRFCGKKSPFVSFYKNAHVISEFLGNKTYVSDFECDECNGKFSRYETDLASYLGIVRTVQSVKGKKAPKFKSANRNMEAVSAVEDDITNVIKFRRYDGLDQTFEFDKVNKLNIIHYTKPTYTPISVYKALLKMALSVMHPAHLPDYKNTLEFLVSKKHDNSFSGFAMMTRHTMPLTFFYPSPTVMLFRKKRNTDNLFTHVFVLFAMNSIFQIVLPFNRQDRRFFIPGAHAIDTFWCPPLFGNRNYNEVAPISTLSFDLNSSEKVHNEKESLHIPVQGDDLEISKIIDNETGEIKERKFDPSQIMGIDLLMQEITDRPEND